MITTHRIRLLALALSIASLATPAAARTTDTPTFGVWMAQWAQYGRQSAAERLPCLRADKTSCKGAFSSSLAARASGPSSHAAKSAKPKRYDLNRKGAQRAKVTNYTTSTAANAPSPFSWVSGGLVLSFAGSNRLLTVAPGADHESAGVTVRSLGTYLKDMQLRTDEPTPVVTDVAAGVGNNAYGALYDFEDEGGVGENQRGFQEISSLVGAQALLLTSAAVPEPGTLLLIGAGLLALRLATQRRSPRGAGLPGAV